MRGMCVSEGTWRRGSEMTRLERSPFWPSMNPLNELRIKWPPSLGTQFFQLQNGGFMGTEGESHGI